MWAVLAFQLGSFAYMGNRLGIDIYSEFDSQSGFSQINQEHNFYRGGGLRGELELVISVTESLVNVSGEGI